MQSTGRVYRHYKGQYYRVVGHAHDSESGQRLVVYQQLYASDKPLGYVWARPADIFHSDAPARAPIGACWRRFRYVKRVPRAVQRVMAQLDRE